MSSPQIEQIKQRVDIVDLVQSYVKLEKSGINFRGRCPFHQERTPSFFVSPTRQTWRCFGCNKGGDHFTFIEEIEGVEFPDALKALADRAGVQLVYEDPKIASERSRLYAISEEAAKFFEHNLWGADENRATPMLQYLLQRGMTESTIKAFRIGYAPDSWDALFNHLTRKGYRGDELEKAGLAIPKTQTAGRGFYDRYRNRIIFPIADASGKIIGFGGRIFPTAAPQKEGEAHPSPNASEGTAKYINSPETPIYHKSHVLYAFDKAKQAIREKDACILVEGYMDAVMAHQAGATHTVAVSGTALTPDQLKIISRLTNTVIFSFDMDSAGQSATKRSLDLAAEFNLQRKVLLLPSGKDPADAVRENPEIFLTSLQGARPLMEYYFEEIERRYAISDPQEKKQAGQFFLPHVKALTNEIERSHWMQKFADLVGVPEIAVRMELEKITLQTARRDQTHELAARKKKSRRELLEEELLTLYLENPSVCESAIIAFPEPIPFSILAHERLFNELKEHKETVSPELIPLYDTLQFRREMIQRPPEKLPEAVTGCINGIMKEFYKEKQADLHVQIKHLEKSENRDRMKHLLTDFHAVSAKIQKYNV